MAKRKLKASNYAIAPRSVQTLHGPGASTLIDLPIELIWQIASYIKTPTLIRDFEKVTVRKRSFDLCALRSVCRNLRDKVQDVFLAAAFHKLDVDLTRSALDALIEISRTNEYAKTVRELHFVMAEAWPDRDDWSEAYEQEMMERNHVERGTGAVLLSRALEGLKNLEAVRVKPVMWVSGDCDNIHRYKLQLLI